MSKYTMSVRELCESDLWGRDTVESWFKSYDLSTYLTPDQIETIETYGVFNKDKLANMIVNHYYMEEIGFETPKLFEMMCKNTMNELMGYYADLIYSASIDYDMLVNVNYTETINRDITNSGTSSSSGKGSGLAINSDTPQSQINKTDILNGKYASSTSASESESTSTDTASSNGNEAITRNKKGNDGVMATNQKLISQYRDIIRNINYEIIKDLETLFMGLY